MNEKTTELLTEYDIKVNKISRARGGFICDTDRGLKLFKEYKGTPKHLEMEYRILEIIKMSGKCCADFIIKNKQEQLVTQDEDGNVYMLKDWYSCHECSVWDRSELVRASSMLGKLHNVIANGVTENEYELYPCNLKHEYERHNIEMRRARAFMHKKNNKTEFELKMLSSFDEFYENAVKARDELELCEYKELRENAYDRQSVCHGSFNYHNIIFIDKEAAPVNFERAVIDVQITDLYDFLRKVLEKHNWDMELGYKIIDEYDKVRTITYRERKLLRVMLVYPEKFWKLLNQYYNSSKSWMPEKNMSKLMAVSSQEAYKRKFVSTIL